MLRFIVDENFNNDILHGLLRRRPELDIVRVQDVGLAEEDDPPILAWAAHEGRILLTQDVRTIPRYAHQRVRAGLPMPGVIEVSQSLPINQAIEEILLISECIREGEWEGQVHYLPL